MNVIGMALRAEARAKWRAWVGLGLILGLAAGASIACVAGARRTQTAYDRFLTASNAADITTGGGPESLDAQTVLKALAEYPEVESSARYMLVSGRVRFREPDGGSTSLVVPEVAVATEVPPDGVHPRFGRDIDRYKILDGSLPRPGHNDEAAINYALAGRHKIRIGSRITVVLGDPFGFGPQKDVALRIVGITAAPSEFQGIGTLTVPSIAVAYTFPAAYLDWMPPPSDLQANNMALRLRHGSKDTPAFFKRLNGGPYSEVDVFAQPDHAIGVKRTMDILAVALFAASIVLAVTALAIFGQAISRQLTLSSIDHPTLHALGSSRRQLSVLGIARAAIPTGIGVVTAFAVAFLASPLFPIGAARIAEPDPGFSFDPVATVAGAGVTLVLCFLLSLWPALKEARSAQQPGESETHPSLAATTAQNMSASAPVVAGLRLALEPGRGRTAVPVRSTIAGVAIALAAITGAVVVASSLDNLLDHPALAGQTYDGIIVPQGEEPTDPEAVRSLSFVARGADGTALNGVVGGRGMFGVVFAEGAPIGFSVIDGRAPTDDPAGGLPTAALGVKTMERLHLRIGDTTTITIDTQDTEGAPREVPLRVRTVGRVAIPSFPFGVNPQGEGFALSLGTLRRVLPEEGGCCFVRFRPGTDRDAAAAEAQKNGFQLFFSTERADLNTLAQLSTAPLTLAGILGLIAAAVLVHTLITAVRRRRRDLAILKTLGFVRAQARKAVAVQSSAIVILALAVGVPTGVMIGRWGWRFFSFSFGVVPAPVAPVRYLAVIVPAVVAFANLVALLPARAAAATKPALILRSE